MNYITSKTHKLNCTFLFDTWEEYLAFKMALRFANQYIYANHIREALHELHERLQNVKEKEGDKLGIRVPSAITRPTEFALLSLAQDLKKYISEDMSKAILKQFVKK